MKNQKEGIKIYISSVSNQDADAIKTVLIQHVGKKKRLNYKLK